MNPFKPKGTKRSGPEAKIQENIIKRLKQEGWHVMPTHGNMYQSGFPDLYATHARYGVRWIEVKNPEAYSFTAAQLLNFPLMWAHGSPVWVLIDDSDEEMSKLFEPCNFHLYMM